MNWQDEADEVTTQADHDFWIFANGLKLAALIVLALVTWWLQ